MLILSFAAAADCDRLIEIQNKAEQLTWANGPQTAGKVAQVVKPNEQAFMDDPAGQALRKLILPHITANRTLRAAARPRRFSRILASKNSDGGFYGPHVDNVIMAQGDARMRSDISFTLFLSSPGSYEGGELATYNDGLTQRRMLYELEQVRQSLREKLPVQAQELLALDKSIANLLRMWAQP